MPKTILITGATDGIGLETAKLLSEEGHNVLLHGRNPAKLEAATAALPAKAGIYIADFSNLSDVIALSKSVTAQHDKIDVLINNAGVLKSPSPVTPDGLDVRFVVNTIAPYLLTRHLLSAMGTSGRIINLSSAAQAPVDLAALKGEKQLEDMAAYSQSKLAITMWTRALAAELPDGPLVIAVNPGSLLASKMVKEGFGVPGNDLRIGADILRRAALAGDFASHTGAYFDNDAGRFAPPHPAGLDAKASKALMAVLDAMIADAA
ncbi:MAG: SDR family NAD(P)-dependent oxidoreductase [Pseudomonadota bacterium]